MKRIVCLLVFLFLFACHNSEPIISNKDHFALQYQDYKIDTNFIIETYHLTDNDNYYIINALTADHHKLEMKFKKSFDGYVEVKEKVYLNEYSYQYVLHTDMNDIKDARMKSTQGIDVEYDVKSMDSSCHFKGYVKADSLENIDYVNHDFYVIENGQKRCDINKSFYINVERL